MAPRLLLLETNPEAKVVVAVARGVVVALGGTQVRPGVDPGTTAFDPVRARCPRLAPKTHILALHTLNFSLQATQIGQTAEPQ